MKKLSLLVFLAMPLLCYGQERSASYEIGYALGFFFSTFLPVAIVAIIIFLIYRYVKKRRSRIM
ncbi:MAG TPA: hypothetical protein VD927_14940 [Chryseosolibacter sp.]|nr:hypothetical protein [Chryseosolibacter sp.]